MTDDDMRNEKLSMITNIKILLQLKKKIYIYICRLEAVKRHTINENQ